MTLKMSGSRRTLQRDPSSQINLPKKTVHGQEIINSVDNVITRYYYNIENCLDVTPYNIISSTATLLSPVAQSEKVALCEMNVDLWDKALYTATGDTTRDTYPKLIIVKKLINCVLNNYSSTDLGLSKAFLSKLVLLHPPERPKMREYYSSLLLTDNYISLNENCVEEQNLFWCLIDCTATCLESNGTLNGCENWHLPRPNEDITQQAVDLIKYLRENKNVTNLCQSHLNRKRIIYFENLTPDEKVKRCLVLLSFISDVLENDFIKWFKSNRLKQPSFKKETRPLLSCLLWRDARDIGIVNKDVQKILHVQKLLRNVKSSQTPAIDKLVMVLSELIRCSDSIKDPVYPFIGSGSNALAREFALLLIEYIKLPREESLVQDVIVNLQPPWFKLLVCAQILGPISGNQCPPELLLASDFLEVLKEIRRKNGERSPEMQKRNNAKADPKIVERFRKLKSVNSKLSSGSTRLHMACAQGKFEEVRALLTFSELDVNASDNNGWTALHQAAFKGHLECVQELLDFHPPWGDIQRPVDTRARGSDSFTPLMCATVHEHAEVCRALLQHTGSVLLEDVDEANRTALELSSNSEVTLVLQHYKKNVLVTEHSKRQIAFPIERIDMGVEICVQMIVSYFRTHRTWDVYHAMKSGKVKALASGSKPFFRCNYNRYHRDIRTNLPKLRQVVLKLKGVKEFESAIEPLICLLSLNKVDC